MRRTAARLAMACLLAAAASADASENGAEEVTGTRQASVFVRLEQPDHGLDAWHAMRVEIASTPGNWQRSWQAAAVSESRFGDRDQGIELGASLPLDARWLLQVDASMAPAATFLPRHSAEMRLVRRFDHGFLATAGIRGARYRAVRADRAMLSLERYAGAWRISWTGSLVRVAGAHSPGHALAVDRYFGDRDSIGLRLSRDRELVPLADGMRTFARVRSASLQGRHWLSRRWGVQAAAGYTAQSGLYDRAWWQLGLMHAW